MTLNYKSKPNRTNHNQGRIVLSILIIFSIILMSFFYIIQSNGVVSQGYGLREIEKQIEKLRIDNQKLQIETARLQFPANLAEIAQKLNMVEAENTVYLKQPADVALNPQTNN